MLEDAVVTPPDQDAGEQVTRHAPTRYKGVAILGSNPATKMTAPFDDAGFLVYSCSPDNSPFGLNPSHCSPLPRVDQAFEIHNPVFDRTRPYAYLDWLRNIPVVWMRDQVAMQMSINSKPLFPTAKLYPEKEMKTRFGIFTFTSTIAFMFAKAIVDCEEMRAKGLMPETPQIGLWGILQRSKVEYEAQRQGTQNMIHEATKAGIKVLASAQSGLFEPPPETF
jgi:hypothetical protein